MAHARLALALVLVTVLAPGATARKKIGDDFVGRPPREVPAVDGRIMTAGPRPAQPAHLAGSTIAAVEEGALVLDPDSGQLVKLDAAGTPIARLDIGRDAAQLVFDPARRRAYVSDRARDRVFVVAVGEGALAIAAAFATPAEPFGLALTPDGRTLLVTTVADRQLAAFDTSNGAALWTRDAGLEPRGVAVSADGAVAAVTSLATGVVTFHDLRGAGAPLARAALAPAAGRGLPGGRDEQGRSFARNAFAVAFVGERTIVVPHQLSTPDMAVRTENRGSYGGSSGAPPLAHRLGFIDRPENGLLAATRSLPGELAVHQPRALAYDRARDLLFVAGFGDDNLVVIADASQPSVRLQWRRSLREGNRPCGPSGLAVASSGEVLAYCELSRRTVSIHAGAELKAAPNVSQRAEIAPTRYRALEQEGRLLFFSGNNSKVSMRGAMACASCHPEGRADGLSWRIEGVSLQTPVLAGRTVDSHPFKWDGKDATLTDSLTNTVKRLGGSGISKQEARALDAYLATLAPPRAPTPKNTGAVARGRSLFESAETGCASCHSGRRLADGKRHDLAIDLEHVDTPSLLGLAQSAPYYHDGSAATLRALLLGNATVHGMGRTGQLSSGQIDDLIAYLETL